MGDLARAAAAELDAGRYPAALELYRNWEQQLAEADALNRIANWLGQSACHLLATEDQTAGQALYRRAYALLVDESERASATAARCWHALADYGQRLGRYDLVEEGYEQALERCRDVPDPALAIEIHQAYLDAVRVHGDRLLARKLEERLAELSSLEDTESPDSTPTEPLEMIELSGGTFQMGSPESDYQAIGWEQPQHEVSVSAFAMARFPVTRWLYRETVGTSPSEWEQDEDDDDLPATYVTWFDAVAFCNRLSQRQGRRPCYRVDGRQVEWDRGADGYRLPTEAEWEYAVRAGTATRWFFGDDSGDLDRFAWFSGNYGYEIHPVGQKESNPWGFHDLIGNVYEWCWDWYGDYSPEPVSDPVGPDGGGGRVLRGCTLDFEAWDLRSAHRGGDGPVNRYQCGGFRCARGPRRQPS